MPSPRSTVTIESLKQSILRYSRYVLGTEWEGLSGRERFLAVSLAVRDPIIDSMLGWQRTSCANGTKHVYYLSMEFLLGRVLGHNLLNLGIEDRCRRALEELDSDLDDLLELEKDPALGNGGLGRLAACFVDSMATLGLAGYGYGINYEFGLFRQAFKDGYQEEHADVWRSPGTPWLIVRPDFAHEIPVYGEATRTTRCGPGEWTGARTMLGVPSDLPVVGFGGRTVNYLRLYAAHSSTEFDMKIFNTGDYLRAVERKLRFERISKVLYPSDDIPEGRELRLLQEYFFVACALKDIVGRHGTSKEALRALPQHAAIQLNDTHPALAVAELMRILVDAAGLPWDEAFEITRQTIAYTNHTLMPEAQERWPVAMIENVLPRHLQIILDLNERFLEEIEARWPGDEERRRRLSLIEENGDRSVRMMNLSIVGSHSVNGVSELHSKLLTQKLVPDFHALWPTRFNNKTNGVTHRRWLLKANPDLARLISARIGDRWIQDLTALRALESFADDPELHAEFVAARRRHKDRLARIIHDTTEATIDPAALCDVQIKRIHEYKRQLMNALRIVHDYLALVDDGKTPAVPRTYVFGGKAAPGYAAAKRFIKLINDIAATVNADPKARDWMKVAFIPDYRVTLAEWLIPAADVSEQISTAGMEASGTGNMKFMMNGALTVGTLDGANIEMAEEAGRENLYIFGLTAEQIEAHRRDGTYHPAAVVAADADVARVLAALKADRFNRREPGLYKDLADGLRTNDPYFVLADLRAFIEIQSAVATDFLNRPVWMRKCLLNIARSGKFSSDRTIREYAREIWGVA